MNDARRTRLADVSALLQLSAELLADDPGKFKLWCRHLLGVAWRLLDDLQLAEARSRSRVPLSLRSIEGRGRYYDLVLAEDRLAEAMRVLAEAIAPHQWHTREVEVSRALIARVCDELLGARNGTPALDRPLPGYSGPLGVPARPKIVWWVCRPSAQSYAEPYG